MKYLVIFLLLFVGCFNELGALPLVSPDDYGATVNDGNCDYQAILDAVEVLNDSGGGILRFSSGTYLIDTFKITGGVDANGIDNIVFSNLNDLAIVGSGTVIELKGDFYRSKDYQVGDNWYSYKASVCPFVFENCSNFIISGIEIDGNVDQMTRHSETVSTGVSGIATKACRNYTIEDVEVHHFHTDGIALGASPTVADTGVTLTNVSSHHHARDALTIYQMRYALITGCTFKQSGYTGGNYARHAPAAGTNIEVYWEPDFPTGAIEFNNCVYDSNHIAFIVASATDSLTIDNCDFINYVNASYYMLVTPNGGVVKNCSLATKAGYAYLNYGDNPDCELLVDSCVVTGTFYGFVVHGNNGYVTIQNTDFIGGHTSSFTGGFPRVFGYNTIFSNNYMWYNGAMHDGTTWSNCTYLKHIDEAHDNSFETDLDTTGGLWFWRSYGITDVENETFLSEGFE